jgi:N12 class adenine-specific DNA methylase
MMEELTGIKGFLKKAVEKEGKTYDDNKANELLKAYNNDYDKLIGDIAVRSGFTPEEVEPFKKRAYEQFKIQPFQPEQSQQSVDYGPFDPATVAKSPQAKQNFERWQIDQSANNIPAITPGMPIEQAKKVAEANKELTTQPEPAEKGSMSGFGKELGQRVQRSGWNLNEMLANTPDFINRVAVEAINLPIKGVGKLAEVSGLIDTADNWKLVATDLKPDNVNQYIQQQKGILTSEIAKINPKANIGIVESAQKGDWATFTRNLAGGVADSFAPSLAMMISGGTMGVGGMIGSSTAVFGAGKYAEMNEQAPNMSEQAKVFAAATNGALEGIFETYLGSGAVGSAIRNVVATQGRKAATDIVNKGIRQGFIDLLIKHPALAPLGEGFEEMGTQIAQNYVDKISGYKPDINIMDGVVDAGLIGTLSGGLHTGVLYGAQAISGKEKVNPEQSILTVDHAQTVEAKKVKRNEQIDNKISGIQDNEGNVTTVEIDGQKWFVKNSEDLGKPGATIFVRDEQGNVKPVNSKKITTWNRQTPEEVKTDIQNEDAFKESERLKHEAVIQKAAENGIVVGAEIENEFGTGTVTDISKEGVITAQDENGQISTSTIEETFPVEETPEPEPGAVNIDELTSEDAFLELSKTDPKSAALILQDDIAEARTMAEELRKMPGKRSEKLARFKQADLLEAEAANLENKYLQNVEKSTESAKNISKPEKKLTEIKSEKPVTEPTKKLVKSESSQKVEQGVDGGEQKRELDEQINAQNPNLNPTERQKETGIYDKARVNVQGYNVTIETPKGAERSGTDDNGKKWSVTMNNHYGELDGTVGYDGDPIDVFIGENPNGNIFVIDQNRPGTSNFDESKVMLGFDTAEQAKQAYLSNFEEGWTGFRSIAPAGDNFKQWLYDGAKQRKPFGDYKNTPEPVKSEEPYQQPPLKEEPKEPAKDQPKEVDTIGFLNALKKDGKAKLSDYVKPETPAYGATNTIFTEDAAAAARERLRLKRNNLNVGLDFSAMSDVAIIAGYHIESGARKFADFVKRMTEDIGEEFKPYFKGAYENIRRWPGMEQAAKEMDSTEFVDKANIDEILNENTNGTEEQPRSAEVIEPEIKAIETEATNVKSRKQAGKILERIDDLLSEVEANLKLKLTPYSTEGIDHESPNIEVAKRIKKDVDKYAKALAKSLGWDHDTDKKGKIEYSHANIPPAGGEATFILWKPGTDIGIYVSIPYRPEYDRGYDDYKLRGLFNNDNNPILWRFNDRKNKYSGGSNRYTSADISVKDFSELILRNVPETKQNEIINVEQIKKQDDGKQGLLQSNNKRPLTGQSSTSTEGTGERKGTGGSTGLPGSKVSGTNEPEQQSTGRQGDILPGNADILEPALVEFNADENDINSFNPTQKYNDNIKAIETVISLISEKRKATPAEKEILSKYVGFGGLKDILLNPDLAEGWKESNTKFKPLVKRVIELAAEFDNVTGTTGSLNSIKGSILNAHFTSSSVIRSIYDGLSKLGFTGGKILEPSAGIGNFVTFMPNKIKSKSDITAVELDDLTGSVLKYLHDDVYVKVTGIQDANIPDNSQDLVISNVPFGNYKIFDKTFKGEKTEFQNRIHNYFFAKAVDMAREGGIIAFVTSKGVLDAPGNESLRRYLDQNTEFLGAVRLPDKAFKNNANTEVVTDIIFLRKNTTEVKNNPDFISVKKVNAVHKDGEQQDVNVNQYFIDNPQNMLGNIVAGGLYSREDYTVENKTGYNLTEAIKNALPEGIYTKVSSNIGSQANDSQANYDSIKEGNIDYIGEQLVKKDGVQLVDITINEPVEKIKHYIKLRNALMNLIYSEYIGKKDNELDVIRTELNNIYDSFVKAYGKLDKSAVKIAKQDSDGYNVLSLQVNGKKDNKADIFRQRTIQPINQKNSAETIEEAIVISLYENASIDIERIAELMKLTVPEVIAQSKGKLFEEPTGGYVTRDEYLSGNVKKKLKQAQQAVASGHSEFQNNVDELLNVIPKDIPALNIEARLGSRWIPQEVYTDFAKQIFNDNGVSIVYRKTLDDYTHNGRSSTFEATNKYGTNRINGMDVLVHALMINPPLIYDTIREWGGERRVLNVEETAKASEKYEEIRKLFEDWVYKTTERRTLLAGIYNEKYNTSISRQYNGDHLNISGINGVTLRKHQKDAIWMLLQNNGGIIDHLVGAGKTYVMVAGTMEMKRTGIAKKPMIIALKSTIPQIVESYRSAFPMAKILAPMEKDFQKENRNKLFAQIANNEWDCIIISHENYGKIPHEKEIQEKFIQDEMAEVEAERAELEAAGEKLALKGLEIRLKNLEARLSKISEIDHDLSTTFEQMGVDHIMVDESQQFKNLSYVTKQRGVAGLSKAEGSKRAFNLFIGARYLQQRYGADKGITFLSGTPITNSMVEAYLLLKYLRPNKMAELGFNSFDSWATTFASPSSDHEFSVTGEIKKKTRFREFINVPELSILYREIADIRTDENTPLDKPKMKGNGYSFVDIKMNKDQKRFGRSLMKFAKYKSGSYIGMNLTEKQEKAYMLLATNLSSKMAIDMRLINPKYSYDPNGKIGKLVDNVSRIFNETSEQKGTQLIFSDLGTPKNKTNKTAMLRDYMEDELGTNLDTLNEIFGDPNEAGYKYPSTRVIRQRLEDVLELTYDDIEKIFDDAEHSEGSFNIYAEVKYRLMEQGIPEEQIVFIHDYNTQAKKEKLFKEVQQGNIRIVLGSTQKLGTGVNVQDRIVAVHHLDVPWTPASMEQRNGRALRQGNWLAKQMLNDELPVYAYATELTLDAYKYQLLFTKQKFLTQFKLGDLKGQRVIKESDGDSESGVGYAELVAMLSGNPDILTKAKLEQVIEALKRSKRNFLGEYYEALENIKSITSAIPEIEKRIELTKENVSAITDKMQVGEDGKMIVSDINGEVLQPEKDEKGKLIPVTKQDYAKKAIDIIKDKLSVMYSGELEEKKLFTINGLHFFGYRGIANSITGKSEYRIHIKATNREQYSVNFSEVPGILLNNIEKTIEGIPDIQRQQERTLQRKKDNLASYQQIEKHGDTWEKETELESSLAELKVINQRLDESNKFPLQRAKKLLDDYVENGSNFDDFVDKIEDFGIDALDNEVERYQNNIAVYENVGAGFTLTEKGIKGKEATYKYYQDEFIKNLDDKIEELTQKEQEAEAAKAEGDTDGKIRIGDLSFNIGKDSFVTMATATDKQGNEKAVVRINTQLSNQDYARRVKPTIDNYFGEWNSSYKVIIFDDVQRAQNFKRTIESEFRNEYPTSESTQPEEIEQPEPEVPEQPEVKPIPEPTETPEKDYTKAGVLMPVEPYTHTKTGEKLFNVKFNGRVSKDDYQRISFKARMFKPVNSQKAFSPFADGFLFYTQEDANKFKESIEKQFGEEDDVKFRIIGETGAANLDKAEEATTRLDNLKVAREMEKSTDEWSVDSKIKDVVYHTTDAEIDEFKPTSYGSYGENGFHYFAFDKNWGKKFVQQEPINNREDYKTEKYNLNIKNPLDLSSEHFKTVDKWINYLENSGVKVSETTKEIWNKKNTRKTEQYPFWKLIKHDNGTFRNDLINSGFDGMILNDVARVKGDNRSVVAVNPNQIRKVGKVFTPQQIKLATGWERGADGKWRYEVPDGKLKDGWDKMHDDDTPQTLSEVWDDTELFKAYPQLKDVYIGALSDQEEGMDGSYTKNGVDEKPTIYAGGDGVEQMASILAHEIQHAIQSIENFAQGGDTNAGSIIPAIVNERKKLGREMYELSKTGKYYSEEYAQKKKRWDELVNQEYEIENPNTNNAFKLYKRLAGEVESRNVQTRMNYTPEQRRQSLLEETEDVSRKDQIFIYDSLGANMEEAKPEKIDISGKANPDIKDKKNTLNALNTLVQQFGVPITVIHSSELSEVVGLAAKRKKGTPVAFYHNGTAYIISDKIQSVSDTKESYLHEAILHKGLNILFNAGPVTVLGNKYNTKNELLDEVYSRLDQKLIDEIAAKYTGGKTETPKQQREIAEEVLAKLNELDKTPGRLEIFVDSLWKFIKKLVGFSSKQFTRTDLHKMLSDHRKQVQKVARGGISESSDKKLNSALDFFARLKDVAQTETANFKKWFGNSKVVDENGKPLVVYHGTKSNLEDEIKPNSYRYNGFYTSSLASYANQYAEWGNEPIGSVMPLYAKIENPLIINLPEFNSFGGSIATKDNWLIPTYRDMSKGQIELLKKDGYDGIIVNVDTDKLPKSSKEYGQGIVKGFEVVVFDPKNVKSATGNRGTFDENDPNINFRFRSTNPELNKVIDELDEYKKSGVMGTTIKPPVKKVKVPKTEGKGVEKTIVTERTYKGDISEAIRRRLEEIGLTRERQNQKVAEQIGLDIIAEIGLDNAVEAVRNYEVKGAPAAAIYHKLLQSIDSRMDRETDPERYDKLAKEYADLIEEMGLTATIAGQYNAFFNYIYQTSDLGFNAEKMIKDYKKVNNGEISAEMEDKFRKLQAEFDEVMKKLSIAEEKAKQLEEQAAIDAIKASIERQNKRKAKASEKIRETTDKLIALIDAGKLNRPGVFSAATPGSLAWDLALETVRTAVKATGRTIEAIAKGFEAIKSTDWYKNLDANKQKQAKNAYFDYFTAKEDDKEQKEQKEKDAYVLTKNGIRIPHSIIRDLVEQGIDNINDLTQAVYDIIVEDFPEITIRETRDAITGYGDTMNQNQEEIEKEIRKMKFFGRVISGLEDVEQGQRPKKSGLQRDKPDPEQRAANKQLREAMKLLPVDEERKLNQQKTQLDAAKQRLINQIEDLQREIDKGEQTPKNVRTMQEDDELQRLKALRDAKKKEHAEKFNDEDFINKKRVELTKKAVNRRIAELEKRIADGDFAPKAKKELIADNELIRLRAEKLRIQEEYKKEMFKAKLRNRTQSEKIKDGLWDAWGVTRALRATGEFSFVGIQGLINTIAHPIQAKQAFKTSMRFLASQRKADDWMNTLKAQDFYPALKESKLAITEPNAELTAREELFYSGWTDMIWNNLGKILGKKSDSWMDVNPLRAIERAAVGYLDTQRVLRYLDGVEMLKAKGLEFNQANKQAYVEMADVINTFTGRGSIGRLNPDVLTKIFFSPRNWSSVIKTATPYAFYHFGKKRAGAEAWKPSVAQKMALADFSKFVGLTASIVALAALALNGDDDDETKVELDPRSTDFGKIKIGSTRIDPWGGRIQQIVLISRLMNGNVKNSYGEVIPIGTPYKSPTGAELLFQMATNKLAPSASILYKHLSAKVDSHGNKVDTFGEPYSLTGTLTENLYPIYWETLSELAKDDITVLDGVLAAYSFFGGGVNVYDQTPEKLTERKLKEQTVIKAQFAEDLKSGYKLTKEDEAAYNKALIASRLKQQYVILESRATRREKEGNEIAAENLRKLVEDSKLKLSETEYDYNSILKEVNRLSNVIKPE